MAAAGAADAVSRPSRRAPAAYPTARPEGAFFDRRVGQPRNCLLDALSHKHRMNIA